MRSEGSTAKEKPKRGDIEQRRNKRDSRSVRKD